MPKAQLRFEPFAFEFFVINVLPIWCLKSIWMVPPCWQQ